MTPPLRCEEVSDLAQGCSRDVGGGELGFTGGGQQLLGFGLDFIRGVGEAIDDGVVIFITVRFVLFGLLFGFLFFAGYGCLFGGSFLLGLGGSIDLLICNRSNRVSTGDTLFEGGEEILRIKGAPYILITFFAYSAMETTTGLWASSYLVQYLLMEPEKAAKFASFFYLGITVGRFLCGFVADRMGDKALIRLGGGIVGAGILLVLIPFPVTTPALLGLVIIGFGCAPVYPAIIHSTPFYFGKENSQALIGIQMACAYVGSTFMPPLFGTLAARIGIWLYPVFLLVFEVLMVLTSEKLNRIQNGSGTE